MVSAHSVVTGVSSMAREQETVCGRDERARQGPAGALSSSGTAYSEGAANNVKALDAKRSLAWA